MSISHTCFVFSIRSPSGSSFEAMNFTESVSFIMHRRPLMYKFAFLLWLLQSISCASETTILEPFQRQIDNFYKEDHLYRKVEGCEVYLIPGHKGVMIARVSYKHAFGVPEDWLMYRDGTIVDITDAHYSDWCNRAIMHIDVNNASQVIAFIILTYRFELESRLINHNSDIPEYNSHPLCSDLDKLDKSTFIEKRKDNTLLVVFYSWSAIGGSIHRYCIESDETGAYTIKSTLLDYHIGRYTVVH
jgi:hypothetical protein